MTPPIFPTPAGVAYQIPGGVNSLRDRCRGRKSTRDRDPVVARFARTTGYRTRRLQRLSRRSRGRNGRPLRSETVRSEGSPIFYCLPSLQPRGSLRQFGMKTLMLPEAELVMMPLLTVNTNVSMPRKPVLGV